MKITIINQHTNNFGDEAAGIALIDTLFKKVRDAKIYLIYNGDGTIHCDRKNLYHMVDYKLKYMGYFNLFMKILFHGYKGNKTMQNYDNLIKESDYVFVAPCGANIGIYKDWRFLMRILLAIFAGKTPIFHLNTIGESGNFIFDQISLYALRKSKVYVREKKSFEYLKSKKIKSELGIDTAFLLDINNKYNVEAKKITLVLSDLSKHKNFKDIDTEEMIKNKILPEIYEFANENKFSIHILPHLNTQEEMKFINMCIDELKSKYKFKDIKKDNIETVFDYYKMIAESELVIGMRYHAIILAAKSNVPFVALAYENKMIEASEYTKMSRFCIKLYENFNKNSIKSVLNQALDEHDVTVNKLKKVNKEIRHLAELPLGEIKNAN